MVSGGVWFGTGRRVGWSVRIRRSASESRTHHEKSKEGEMVTLARDAGAVLLDVTSLRGPVGGTCKAGGG